MHFRCYVFLPREQAQSSLEAREKVAAYLDEEGFSLTCRFGGRCDYFSIGGRWSGSLSLLRLKQRDPHRFRAFWKRYECAHTSEEALSAFRSAFPGFRGTIPVARPRVGYFGLKDDAQIVDRELFTELKPGFSDDVNFSWDFNTPNVISTEYYDKSDWPRKYEAAQGKGWVVVVDYHD